MGRGDGDSFGHKSSLTVLPQWILNAFCLLFVSLSSSAAAWRCSWTIRAGVPSAYLPDLRGETCIIISWRQKHWYRLWARRREGGVLNQQSLSQVSLSFAAPSSPTSSPPLHTVTIFPLCFSHCKVMVSGLSGLYPYSPNALMERTSGQMLAVDMGRV